MGEVEEKLVSIGGTAADARRAATDWSDITGTLPGTLAKLLDNPYFSGMVSQQTGVLPEAAGAVSQGTRTRVAYQMMRDMERSYQGVGPKTEDIIMNGQKVGERTISARQQREALAAADMGMDLTEYQRFKQGARREEKAGGLLAGLQSLNENLRYTPGGAARDKLLSEVDYKNKDVSLAELTQQMGKAGIGTATQRGHIRELASDGEWGKARKMARELITESTKNEESSVDGPGKTTIELSDEAKKWFKLRQRDAKAEARRTNKDKRNRGAQTDWNGNEPGMPAHPGTSGWQSEGFKAGSPGTGQRPGSGSGVASGGDPGGGNSGLSGGRPGS
jgi:hypothetical protein